MPHVDLCHVEIEFTRDATAGWHIEFVNSGDKALAFANMTLQSMGRSDDEPPTGSPCRVWFERFLTAHPELGVKPEELKAYILGGYLQGDLWNAERGCFDMGWLDRVGIR